MADFRVWAPRAEAVTLLLAGRERPMDPAGRGYWVAEYDDARAGDDYAFILDGGEPIPDPRSPWQPDGIHGLSRLVDHEAFEWSDAGWAAPRVEEAVIYELHVGTFTPEGTFEAAIARLPYLRDLGVTHVELMPVAEFPGDHGWGYDGVSLYAPKHAYGGPQGLKLLVNACHEHGLAVLLDVVYNHLGPDGNYLPRFGPYFTDEYRTPWGDGVNLDGEGSDEVRRFFIDNALMWLRDYHIDGLRLDASDRLYDSSAVHFLEQLASAVHDLEKELGRRFVVTGENDLNDPRLVRPRALGGFGLDAQWLDDFHHALHTVLTGEQSSYYTDFGRLSDLATSLQGAYVYAGRYSPFRGHRRGRRPSVTPADDDGPLLSGSRFIAFMQNHDQVGNRAQGDRMGHLVDEAQVRIGAALLLLGPFVPLLFQGEEWNASTPFLYFTDHDDPQLAEAVSQGRRASFGDFGWDADEVPDPQDAASFLRSKLDWSEPGREPHRSMLDWYRQLLALRREHAALQDHQLEDVAVDYDEEARWLVLYRGPLAVVCHLNDGPGEIRLRAPASRVLMASEGDVTAGEAMVRLSGPGVAIVALDG